MGAKQLLHLIALLAIIILAGCSPQRSTWTSKAFHNTTAHYNGYYYAREELKRTKNQLLQYFQ